jgi:Kef-type K+ transport system membrane component KefB
MSASTSAHAESRLLTRLAAVIGLTVVFAILFVTDRGAAHDDSSFGAVAAVGFLLLGGMLGAQLLEVFKLPHLTAYILVGVVAGPHVLHLVDHETVKQLSPVNTLALALIALAGGVELQLPMVMAQRRSLSYAMTIHAWFGGVLATGAFMLSAPFLPFARGQSLSVIIGIAALWGGLAVSRSPSATLAILSETRPDGPITRFALAFVMSSDIVVAVLMSLVIALVRPLIEPLSGISLRDVQHLGHELLGSMTLGMTLGFALSLYLWLVSGQLLLVLIAIGFGLTAGLRYLHFDPLLTFLMAGFVVSNLSAQGPKLLHAVEATGSIVFVVFFATAGAHLDLPLLGRLWPVALALAGGRIAITLIAHHLAGWLAKDDPIIRRWGWAPLISQAGLTLGLSAVVETAFPSFGSAFRSLVIATVAINEIIGPIVFKAVLERTGEVGKAKAHSVAE